MEVGRAAHLGLQLQILANVMPALLAELKSELLDFFLLLRLSEVEVRNVTRDQLIQYFCGSKHRREVFWRPPAGCSWC